MTALGSWGRCCNPVATRPLPPARGDPPTAAELVAVSGAGAAAAPSVLEAGVAGLVPVDVAQVEQLRPGAEREAAAPTGVGGRVGGDEGSPEPLVRSSIAPGRGRRHRAIPGPDAAAVVLAAGGGCRGSRAAGRRTPRTRPGSSRGDGTRRQQQRSPGTAPATVRGRPARPRSGRHRSCGDRRGPPASPDCRLGRLSLGHGKHWPNRPRIRCQFAESIVGVACDNGPSGAVAGRFDLPPGRPAVRSNKRCHHG